MNWMITLMIAINIAIFLTSLFCLKKIVGELAWQKILVKTGMLIQKMEDAITNEKAGELRAKFIEGLMKDKGEKYFTNIQKKIIQNKGGAKKVVKLAFKWGSAILLKGLIKK